MNAIDVRIPDEIVKYRRYICIQICRKQRTMNIANTCITYILILDYI